MCCLKNRWLYCSPTQLKKILRYLGLEEERILLSPFSIASPISNATQCSPSLSWHSCQLIWMKMDDIVTQQQGASKRVIKSAFSLRSQRTCTCNLSAQPTAFEAKSPFHVYSRISSVASETKLPFYSTLLYFLFCFASFCLFYPNCYSMSVFSGGAYLPCGWFFCRVGIKKPACIGTSCYVWGARCVLVLEQLCLISLKFV